MKLPRAVWHVGNSGCHHVCGSCDVDGVAHDWCEQLGKEWVLAPCPAHNAQLIRQNTRKFQGPEKIRYQVAKADHVKHPPVHSTDETGLLFVCPFCDKWEKAQQQLKRAGVQFELERCPYHSR